MRPVYALLLVCSVAAPAHALGWSRGSTSYYCPVPVSPVYYYWGPSCYPVTPATPRVMPLAPIAAPSVPFAPTRPAPPSGETKEPPIGKMVSAPEKRGPTIVESRGRDIAPVAASDHCKVGFWNLTGKDVDLNIAGKTHKLRKDQALTVELERQFNWNIVGQPAAQERVAEEKAFHEIILRND